MLTHSILQELKSYAEWERCTPHSGEISTATIRAKLVKG
jgi:hypothetical protein